MSTFTGECQQIRNTSVKDRICFYFSQEKYSKILSEVVSAKIKCNTPLDYRRLKRFDVLKTNDEEKLIVPLKPGETNIQYYRNKGRYIAISIAKLSSSVLSLGVFAKLAEPMNTTLHWLCNGAHLVPCSVLNPSAQ
ncbi:hypothetical protein K0M31_016830 [Melipona bicolor]|uniref:Uncharacterized protein n=1 Tax=Melipona bicolor TaxID=60889 RepID=A0AA40FEC2_9HYME|nr:hypothetical protein K0M31_016830 [Melipona bicolor]